MNDLNALRPEVREAINRTDMTVEMFDTLVTVNRDDYDIIRAELLRLADECATLKAQSIHPRAQLLIMLGHANDRAERAESELTGHKHCDSCGCTWLDNGLNPTHCPYCEIADLRCDKLNNEAMRAEANDRTDAACERADSAEAELAEMKQTFDLRWRADMRAIEQWRVAHPGNELVMPDHADMCVWLMSELASVKARMRPVARVENGEVRALMDHADEGKYVAVVVVEE